MEENGYRIYLYNKIYTRKDGTEVPIVERHRVKIPSRTNKKTTQLDELSEETKQEIYSLLDVQAKKKFIQAKYNISYITLCKLIEMKAAQDN